MKKRLEEILGYDLTQEQWEQINSLETTQPQTRYDLTYKKFNHLTVIAKGPNYISKGGHSSSQWWCICDCPEHNIILVRTSNLTSNNTKSCGCYNDQKRRERIQKAIDACKLDLTNKFFGELQALEPTEKRNGNSIVWKCLCSCGRIHYVAANQLNSGRIESCGCKTESKGVRKIKKILEENNISYTTEQTFPDCKFKDSNAFARFDFYIDNKILVEFDGIQHFKERDSNFFRDSLQKRQEHDEYKNQWCKEHNIPLVRISYQELDNITLDLILGKK